MTDHTTALITVQQPCGPLTWKGDTLASPPGPFSRSSSSSTCRVSGSASPSRSGGFAPSWPHTMLFVPVLGSLSCWESMAGAQWRSCTGRSGAKCSAGTVRAGCVHAEHPEAHSISAVPPHGLRLKGTQTRPAPGCWLTQYYLGLGHACTTWHPEGQKPREPHQPLLGPFVAGSATDLHAQLSPCPLQWGEARHQGAREDLTCRLHPGAQQDQSHGLCTCSLLSSLDPTCSAALASAWPPLPGHHMAFETSHDREASRPAAEGSGPSLLHGQWGV